MCLPDHQRLMELGTELKRHCEANVSASVPKVGEPCCALFPGEIIYGTSGCVKLFQLLRLLKHERVDTLAPKSKQVIHRLMLSKLSLLLQCSAILNLISFKCGTVSHSLAQIYNVLFAPQVMESGIGRW